MFILRTTRKNGARAKTNELAKSCDVLHVVTCREPAGLDQTPEAGTNTKGNITKPFESIIFSEHSDNKVIINEHSDSQPGLCQSQHSFPMSTQFC